MMKWLTRLVGISLLVDLAFILNFGWDNFITIDYWKSLPIAIIIILIWAFLALKTKPSSN